MRLPAGLLLPAALCAAAELYPVAGVVINDQTGTPLPRAEVYLFGRTSPKPVASMTTGDDGRFNLDVPEGSYRFLAGTRVHAQNYGAKNPDEGFGSAVIVGPTHNTTNLTFRWFPLAAIYGKVVDDAGEPVENALVQLVRSSVAAGRRVTRTVAFARTDDLGEYRFGSLPGGARYYLLVSGKPWYSSNFPLPRADQRPVAFVPLYYPNARDATRAAPLTPKPGEELRADFTLTPAAGATVTVKHNLPSGVKAVVNLLTTGIGGADSFLEPVQIQNIPGVPEQDASFTDIPPGHYTVRVTTGAGESSNVEGSAAVDVNGSDVTTEIALHPAPTLSGTVHFKNPNARTRGSALVSLFNEQNMLMYNTPVRPDGSFVFPRVLDGKYRPVFRAAGFFTSAVEVRGAPFRGGFVEVAASDSPEVQLTASDETGELKGFVMKGDQPLDAVLVVLAPATGSDDLAYYHGYQTESDGSFDMTNMPAGRYLLFAVDDTALEFANPAVIRPYLASAKAVTIEAHGSVSGNLALTAAKP